MALFISGCDYFTHIKFDGGETRYNGLCRMAQKLVNILKQMDPRDPYRIEMTDSLLEKL